MSPDDRPPLPVRGAIEGFYGAPFSHAERLELLRFLGEHRYTCYVYAPKNDPLHRERWREPYPGEEIVRFRELAATAAGHGVRFVYAISPGLTYDAASARDFVALADKIAVLVEAGARGIALLFDDLTADSTMLDPIAQAELIARVSEAVARLDAGLDFWFIGNFYCGDVAELRDGGGFWGALYGGRKGIDYFAAYERAVPAHVPILWTGPAVFSARITAHDVQAFRELVARPVILWDNFPVNDTLPGQLFLGPYVGREPEAIGALHGVVLNLASQARANRLPLTTASRFFTDPHAYDPQVALEAAIATVAPRGEPRAALAALVDQQRGHPVLAARDAAPELAARISEAFADDPCEARALEALRAHLEKLAGSEEELRRGLTDGDLLREITPWCEQLTRLARAALLGLDALCGTGSARAYEEARARARGATTIVGASVLPAPLQPFAAGQGEGVDRFAALFEEIDRRLAST